MIAGFLICDFWNGAFWAPFLFLGCFAALKAEAGSRPGGRLTFSCFAKEKYPKERRPEVWVPCAALRGNLRCSESAGGCGTRFAQTVLADRAVRGNLPPPALLGPASTGFEVQRAIAALGHQGLALRA